MVRYYSIKTKNTFDPKTKKQTQTNKLMVLKHTVFKRYKDELMQTTKAIKDTKYTHLILSGKAHFVVKDEDMKRLGDTQLRTLREIAPDLTTPSSKYASHNPVYVDVEDARHITLTNNVVAYIINEQGCRRK